MSYKQLFNSEKPELDLGEVNDANELNINSKLDSQTGQVENNIGDEVPMCGEEDHRPLIEESGKDLDQARGEKPEAETLPTADSIFDLDSVWHRYTRRFLVVAGFTLLAGLVSASVTLIALSPSCPESLETLQWWQTTIIYQAYPRSFQDSDGDGNGDLNGINSRLDYFTKIGVDTVWLNPIYPSPHKDNGYDISNYTNIDPLFGNLSDFKSLLDDMHQKGLHILMDLVPNHSSDQHPWFKESRSSRDNPKRDWYIWADGHNDGGPPNNWISAFGGSAWKYDNLTDQYYYHAFGYFQPDLNYRNPKVQEAMEDVLRFWLDLGVDGFRVDAAVFLVEDDKLRNETRNPDFPPDNCTTNITSPECYNSLIHNLTTNYPGVHQVIKGFRKVLDSYSKEGQEGFMVGEVYGPVSEVVTYYEGQFDFPFNFVLLANTNWTGFGVAQLVASWLDSVPQGAWSNWVLGNHDNPRISSKAGVYLARGLNVLLLTLPGTPTTYYGEEILMTDVYVPPPERHDISGEDRDKERTPMQWNTSNNSGFTFPDATPWLPLATNYTTYNVEVELQDNTSSLSLYQQLAELRSSHPALQYPGYQLVYNSTDIISYLRFQSSSQILVVVNFSEDQTMVDLSDKVKLDKPVILLSSNLNRTGSINLSSVALHSGEALLIKSSK